jgi:hypothetical protein
LDLLGWGRSLYIFADRIPTLLGHGSWDLVFQDLDDLCIGIMLGSGVSYFHGVIGDNFGGANSLLGEADQLDTVLGARCIW